MLFKIELVFCLGFNFLFKIESERTVSWHRQIHQSLGLSSVSLQFSVKNKNIKGSLIQIIFIRKKNLPHKQNVTSFVQKRLHDWQYVALTLLLMIRIFAQYSGDDQILTCPATHYCFSSSLSLSMSPNRHFTKKSGTVKIFFFKSLLTPRRRCAEEATSEWELTRK